jgi:hypothetical protein
MSTTTAIARAVRAGIRFLRLGTILLVCAACLWPVQGIAQGCGFYISSATPETEARMALQFAKVGSGDVFYDLGSGDGVFVIAAANLHAKATGIEIKPSSLDQSKVNAKGTTAKFILGDIFIIPYADATIVEINLGCGPDNYKAISRTCRIAPKARILTPIDADLPDAHIITRSPAGNGSRGWSIYKCGH